MKVFISGPMTGLKGFNRDSFNYAAAELEKMGHEVRNPACLPTNWLEYRDYIDVSLCMLRQCDAIVYLPGTEHSKGVAIEAAEAQERCIKDASYLLKHRTAVLKAMHKAAKQ